MYKRHWVVLQNDYVIMQLMSRCVSIVYRRVSETKHLYRDSDTCHRDRSTVQRDIKLCHRDRLSPRPETNRNFTMAVLYMPRSHFQFLKRMLGKGQLRTAKNAVTLLLKYFAIVP